MEEIILDQNFNEQINLVKATKSKRFANYLIDGLITTIIIYIFTYILDLTILDPETIILSRPNAFYSYYIIKLIIDYLLIVFYYTTTEHFLDGRSIAKFITKTKVLNTDGSIPHLDSIIKRSFSRIVPFNAFSFLGENENGWHDRWSKTIVIDKELSSI